MKLASLKSSHNINGELAVVSRNNMLAAKCSDYPTILSALEQWEVAKPKLQKISDDLNRGGKQVSAFALNLEDCLAPLTQAPGFYDGSAFLSHVVRARKARGDQMPESAKLTPLMYQGVSDNLLAWNSPISLMKEEFGGDFESEFAVVTTYVPKGTPASEMEKHCALFSLFNDITFREIVKTEIETKFGFLQSKPNSSFSPFLVTADELGDAWKNGRIALPVKTTLNGTLFGEPNGIEMHFSFFELVAHACRTRPLSAGNIVGTGTVSNEDKNQGFACLTEKRFQEILDTGKSITPWLKPGDRVHIDVIKDGVSLFGPIDQVVVL